MGVFCVNTTSKEFKGASKRLNIHPSSLEVCVHLFLNSSFAKEQLDDTGELPFPSDDYIREYFSLGNTQSGKEAIDNWVEEFGATDGRVTDKQFALVSLEYPKEALHSYVDNQGSRVNIISRPTINNLQELKYFLQKLNIIDENGNLLGITLDRFYERMNALAIPASMYSKFDKANKNQVSLIFKRIPELAEIGTEEQYLEYVLTIFPNSLDKSIYWHGTNSDFSRGFNSAERLEGSGAPETKGRNDFYLARLAWTVLQYVNGVNRNSVDKNGFAHWNKLWWEFKQIMSNGRRLNNNWKDLVINETNVRQAIPNKKGIFNRDLGKDNGKWLKEVKADYGYENKSDKEFFEEILGVRWGEDTFNTWTQRNAEIFKSLLTSTKGIYPAVINVSSPIRESGQDTYYADRGVLAIADKEGNDTILSTQADNEFGSDIAVVLRNNNNVHFLGTEQDIEAFRKFMNKTSTASYTLEMLDIKAKAIADGTFMKAPNGKDTNLTERQWLQVRTKAFINWFGDWINNPANASKVIDENGEPLVVYHFTDGPFNVFDKNKSLDGAFYFTDDTTGETIFYPNDNNKKHKIAVFLNIKSPLYANRDDKVGTKELLKRSKDYDKKIRDLSIKGWKRTTEEDKEYRLLRSQGPYYGLIDLPTVLKEKEYEFIKENNADGIIRHWAEKLEDYKETHNEFFYIVFNSNQIKSATDNNGMFSTENNNILFQKQPITAQTRKLWTISEPLNKLGSDAAIRRLLNSKEIDPIITNAIIDAINKEPKLKKLRPLEVFNIIRRAQETGLAKDYNDYILQPIIEELEKVLLDFLKPFHIEAIEDELAEKYGVMGVFDILNKTIHLAKNRNAITVTEEFAHAFIELMGSRVSGRPENADYTFLYNTIEGTSIYKLVYEQYKDTYTTKNEKGETIPDIRKIKKEAIGQALAVAINNKWAETHPEEEKSFWEKLKEWFTGILDFFNNLNNYTNKFLGTIDEEGYIDINELLDKIATEILHKDYSRLNKVNNKKYNLLDYTETLANQTKKDGGLAVEFMQWYSSIGNIITGSLAYRRQGTVYRPKIESLHDIDMVVPASVHGVNFQDPTMQTALSSKGTQPDTIPFLLLTDYFKKVLAQYPDLQITAAYTDNKGGLIVNSLWSKNKELILKFEELNGTYADRLEHFTLEERDLMYLFDFFLEPVDTTEFFTEESTGITLSKYPRIFKAKIALGRAKDIFDYQMWDLFEEFKANNLSEEEYLMFLKPIQYNPEQLEAIRLVGEFIADRNAKEDFFLISGKAGTGKALPVDTIIPTPTGDRAIGSLQIGDYVYDRHGNPTKILGVYPQGELECFKVTLSDDREVLCNDEHIWTYYSSKGNLVNKTLKEMMALGLKPNRSKASFRFKIPTNEAIEYPEAELPVHPYVLGIFLGDGCCKERYLTLSSADEEIVKDIAALSHFSYKKCSEKNFSWTFYKTNMFGFKKRIYTEDFYKNIDGVLQYAHDKRIDSRYIYSSRQQRLLLLLGLFDSDGGIDIADGRYNVRYTSTSLPLIKDIQKVLHTLGYGSHVVEDKRTEKYTNQQCYTLNVKIPNEDKHLLFRLSRKRKIAETCTNFFKRRNYDRVEIVKAEKCNYKKEMVCIYVDNPEGLFLANDYVVTHNTTIINEIVNNETNRSGRLPGVFITAIANKAVLNLDAKIEAPHVKKATASALGFFESVKSNGEKTWKKPKNWELHKLPISRADILFIDECSMLDTAKLDMILQVKQLLPNLKIVMIGDRGQIHSIEDKDSDNTLVSEEDKEGFAPSVVFTYKNKKEASLLTRVRQGEESPVLGFADKFWEAATSGKKELPSEAKEKTIITTNGAVVRYKDTSSTVNKEIAKNLLPLFEKAREDGNPNHVKIVAVHKEQVQRYNDLIYSMLHPDETSPYNPLHAGDMIMFYAPYGKEEDEFGNEISKYYNSSEVVVKRAVTAPYKADLSNIIEMLHKCAPNTDTTAFESIMVLDVEVELDGKAEVITVICPSLENTETLTLLGTKLGRLANEFFREGKIPIGGMFLSLRKLLEERIADVRLNYAISAHKSQGSTYDIVIVDSKDIRGGRVKGERYNNGNPRATWGGFTGPGERAAIMYTAITRASNVTVILHGTNGENANLDIESINEAITLNKLGKTVTMPQAILPKPQPKIEDEKSSQNEDTNWNNIQELWDTIFEEHNDHIEFIDTADKHEYWYYPNGKDDSENKQKMDITVTGLTNPVQGRNAWLDVSGNIGTSADRVVRDFFMGIDVLDRKYPNFTKEQLKTLVDNLNNFKKFLDKEFAGTKYKIVTNPFSVVGKVTKYNGTTQTVGGTVDILIYDEEGGYMIYDIKTTRKDDLRSTKDLEHYQSQVNLYRELLEAMHPELKGKCIGLGILQLHTFYATPEGLRAQGATGTTVYSFDKATNQIQADGISIENHTGYDAPHFPDGNVLKAVIPFKSFVAPKQYYLDGNSRPLTVDSLGTKPIKKTTQTQAPVSTGSAISNVKKATTRKVKGKDVTFSANMYEQYEDNSRDDISSETTLDAIVNGERTATTRWSHIEGFYDQIKEGDIVEFHDKNGRSILVKVTKAPHKLTLKDNAEEWSEKEGWSVEHYNNEVKPHVKAGEAYQMEYEYVEGSLVDDNNPSRSKIEKITISQQKDKHNYKKGYPQKHTDTAFIFTENAQANAANLELTPVGPRASRITLNVNAQERSGGFNQADIRTDKEGNKTENAFGLVVKKYQQSKEGSWVKLEGCFQDTDSDFEIFKKANLQMFDRLENSDYSKVVFPFEIALGKAALPKRFAKWLQQQLEARYGIVTTIEKNKTDGYTGYGLRVQEVQNKSQAKSNKPLFDASENPISESDEHFNESTGGYAKRTDENAEWADVTLALAEDFTTPGEKRTKKAVDKAGKNYVSETLNPKVSLDNATEGIAASIFELLDDLDLTDNIKLNIAGNGMYSLEESYTQEELDELLYKVLRKLMSNGVSIQEIRSGGQTGIDEAGIKAAQKLGIEWSVNAPSNWSFRVSGDTFESEYKDRVSKNSYTKNNDGTYDISDEALFKERFDHKEFQKSYDEQLDEELDEKLSIASALLQSDPINPEEEFSKRELALIKQTRNLIELSSDLDTLFKPSELKSWAKACMFLVSDMISILNSSEARKGEFLKYIDNENLREAYMLLDFTKMDRIEILEKLGDNVFRIIKNYYFNAANNPNGDSFKRKTRKKLAAINENFDAFIEMGRATLAKIENVSDTGNVRRILVDDSEDIIEGQDAETLAEIAGSSVEAWQVNFRGLSAHSSLSLMVKRVIETCYDLDEESNQKLNEIGIPERINSALAVNNILMWTQGAENLGQMVEILKEKQEQHPWLSQLIAKLDESSDDETFKSQFYSNFKKYFQPYIIQYVKETKDPTGRVISTQLMNKVINQNALEKQLLEQYRAAWLNRTEDKMNLYNLDGKMDSSSVDILVNAVDTLREFLDNLDEEDPDVVVPLNIMQLVSDIYWVFDIELDSQLMDKLDNIDTIKNIYKNLTYLSKNLNRNKDKADYDLVKNNEKNLQALFSYIVDSTQTTLESVAYEDGKLHYSYVTPSYLTKLIEKLKGNTEDYEAFLEKEYGQFPWFKDEDGEWRNEWLRLLDENEETKDNLQHAVVLTSEGVGYRDKSPLLYAKSMLQNYFYGGANSLWAFYRVPMLSNKPSEEYIRFRRYIGTEYQDEIARLLMNVVYLEIDRIQTCRQRSNSDVEHIKSFDKNGQKFMFLDYLQEYLDEYLEWRKQHPKGKVSKTNGALLLGQMLEDRINGVQGLDRELFEDLLQRYIKLNMNERFEDYMNYLKAEGVLELDEDGNYIHLEDLKIDGVNGRSVEENLLNFFWNDTFAAINILQLTVTDIAYYKDAEDLQKRLAQIHAPGLRANLDAKWNGVKVVDDAKKTRTIYIKDFDNVVSDVIANIELIFENRALQMEKFSPQEAKEIRQLAKHILEAFKQINVTDALGYSSPSSYRKKAIIFGKWSDELEDVYQKIRTGNYNTRDLEVMMQPLKPFVYSNTTKESVGRLGKLKVGMLNKNSEYLLLMMDAIIQGEENNGNPQKSKLAAIYKVMEDSHYERDGVTYKPDGIDTVQFNSTVKAGEMGVIDINSATTTQEAISMLENAIYDEGNAANGYNLNTVHELDFEDYCIQNEVPAHLEGTSIFGSQMRILSISDMPEIVNNEELLITFRGQRIPLRQLKLDYMKACAANIYQSLEELRKQLKLKGNRAQKNIALSRILQELIDNDQRFGFDLKYAVMTDEQGNFNIPISDPIQAGRIQQLLNSVIKTRINKQQIEGGPVVLVTNFGTSSELSIVFKDAEGNALQTLKEFYDEDNREYSYEEFLNMAHYENSKKPVERKLYNEYYRPIIEEYNKKVGSKQAGILYFECYAPSTVFKDFADENGIVHLEDIPEEMLEIIGFRIPTEFKYSMAPMKIVGLLPSEAGEGIMLPKEITALSGSDFDIDKLYIIRPVVQLDINEVRKEYRKLQGKTYDTKAIWDDIYLNYPEVDAQIEQIQKQSYELYKQEYDKPDLEFEDFLELAKTEFGKKRKLDWISNSREVFEHIIKQWDDIDDYVIDHGIQMTFKEFREQAKKQAKYYRKVTDMNTKKGRDNLIFDSMWSILTSELAMDQIFTPGNFDMPKKYGYMAAVLEMYNKKSLLKFLTEGKSEALKKEIQEKYKNVSFYDIVDSLDTDTLKTAISKSKNLVYNHVHLQFHKQNMVAGKLIGIFALNNVSHGVISLIDKTAKLDSNGNPLRDSNGKIQTWKPKIELPEDLIIINGKTVGGITAYDTLLDLEGNRISNTLAAFLAASVDAVKDPVLNYMNINQTTAGILTALVRMGYNIELAMLLLTLPIVKEFVLEFNIANEGDNYKSFNSLINEKIDRIIEENSDASINEDIIPEISRKGLISTMHNRTAESDVNLLKALLALNVVSDVNSAIISITKFNSVTSALGPMLSNTILLRNRIENNLANEALLTESMQKALSNPIITAFRDATFTASDEIFSGLMLQGSLEFTNLVNRVEGMIRGRMTDKDVNKLADFYMAFMLTRKNAVFRTETNKKVHSKERRKEILEKLPNRVKQAKKNTNNKLLKRLEIRPANDSHSNRWLFLNTRGMSGDISDEIGAAWLELYLENPKLAMDLVEYNFYISGLGFNPNTFSNLIPVALRVLIPNYVELLNPANSLNSIELNRLVDQFFRNNYGNRKLVPDINRVKGVTWKNNSLLINADEEAIQVGENKLPYVIYRGRLFKLEKDFGSKVKYTQVSELGGKKNEILEVNAKVDAESIFDEEFYHPKKEEAKESKKLEKGKFEVEVEGTSKKKSKVRKPTATTFISLIQYFILSQVDEDFRDERINRLWKSVYAAKDNQWAPINALKSLFNDTLGKGTYNKDAFGQMKDVAYIIQAALKGIKDDKVSLKSLEKLVNSIKDTENDLNICG